MKQQDEWETGIDAQFVRRLEQRQHRPGVWDQRVAQRLIARHTRSQNEHDLSARLNRRWQALDEDVTAPVPIVYATPVAPVTMVQQSGNTVQQTVIGNQQSPLDKNAIVSPTQPSRSTATSPIITPSQAEDSFSFASSVAAETAVSTPPFSSQPQAASQPDNTATPQSTRPATPLPLVIAQPPQSTSQADNNAAPTPQSRASARPLLLVTAQPLPAPTADFTLLPNALRQSPATNQPARADTTLGNSASTTPLPLVTTQPPPAQTAVSPTSPPHQVSQPPSWMKKPVGSQGTPDADVNIDTLTNKVEKQLLQRLLIQRERRGKA